MKIKSFFVAGESISVYLGGLELSTRSKPKIIKPDWCLNLKLIFYFEVNPNFGEKLNSDFFLGLIKLFDKMLILNTKHQSWLTSNFSVRINPRS